MQKKMITGKPELMKQINRNLMIQLIVKEGEISRTALAKSTGLALPSVMRIVDGMLEEGIIEELGKGDSTGGRKPGLIRMNPHFKVIIGIEIAIQTTVVISDFCGNPIDQWTSEQMAYVTPEEMLQTILDQMNLMIERNGIKTEDIAGVGVGTPGMNFKYINEVKRSILRGWEQIDVCKWFKQRSKLKFVIDNIARTRTLSELWFGYGRREKSFLYVFVDQGVGIGIVNDGRIYQGAGGVAGEFGHMSIDYQGRPCYCGNKGCIEMYVSAGALTNEADRCLALDCEHATFEALTQRGNQPEIQAILERGGEQLAFGIANLVNLLNPPLIILGGVVPRSCPSLVKRLNETLDQHVFHNNALKTPIVVSQIDEERLCLGSVALVLNAYFSVVKIG